jgi:hypothetical protein
LHEAEQMYTRALAGYEKALGAEHTSTLMSVNNLGILYKIQGKLVEVGCSIITIEALGFFLREGTLHPSQ